MGIFDKNIDVLSKLLDLTSVKSKVIANNIANVNTPGYKKLEVTFQEELREAIKRKNVEKINNETEKIEFSNSFVSKTCLKQLCQSDRLPFKCLVNVFISVISFKFVDACFLSFSEELPVDEL